MISDEESLVDEALAALDRGEPGDAMWWLYRHPSLVRDAVHERLKNKGPMVSWLAASIAAMWRDSAAEPRLIKAIETHEYGFGDDFEWTPGGYNLTGSDVDVEPLTWAWVVPNWLCAVALLRRCGTEACVAAIDRLIDRPVHGIDTLTTAAITLEQLIRRGTVSTLDGRAKVEAILDRMLGLRFIGAVDYAARPVGLYSESALTEKTDIAKG